MKQAQCPCATAADNGRLQAEVERLKSHNEFLERGAKNLQLRVARYERLMKDNDAEIARLTARETEANALLETARERAMYLWQTYRYDTDREMVNAIDRFMGAETVTEGDR